MYQYLYHINFLFVMSEVKNDLVHRKPVNIILKYPRVNMHSGLKDLGLYVQF